MSRIGLMGKKIIGLSNLAVRESSRMDSVFSGLGKLAAGAFAFQGLSDLPQQIVKATGEVQALSIAFTTLIGNKTKAQAFLKEGIEFANKTPFELGEVSKAQKIMLAYGFSVESVIPTLTKLGDISAGTGANLLELVSAFGQIKTQGTAQWDDIMKFLERGANIIPSISQQLGIADGAVKQFVADGKVSFAIIERAITSLVDGSSKLNFGGLMAEQSKSLVGLTSNLRAAWDQMLVDIGKDNEGFIANIITGATTVVESYQQVIDSLSVLAASYGSYRAAIFLVSLAERTRLVFMQTMAVQQSLAALSSQTLTTAQLRQAAATTLLSRAQAGLNAVLNINPFVLLATSIAALVAGYIAFKDEVLEVKTAQELMADSGKEIANTYNKQKSEIDSLISIIKNQNIAESERLNAYKKLKDISPDILRGIDFEKAKTADLTRTVNEYLDSLEKKIRLESGQGKLKAAYDQDAQLDAQIEKARQLFIAKQKAANIDSQKTDGKGKFRPFSVASAPAATAEEEAKAAEGAYNRLLALKSKSLKTIDDIKAGIGGIYTAKTKDALDAEISQIELTISLITDKLSPAYKANEDRLISLKQQREKITEAEKEGVKAQLLSLDEINAKIKEQQELRGKQNSKAGYAAVDAEIKRLEQQKRRLTGELTPEEKKQQRDADRTGPFGSLSYWEAVSKKAEEAASKIPSTNTAELQKQYDIKLNADKQAEALRKQYAIKSFDDELTEKQRLYEVYQKWISAYGQEVADLQFKDLLKSGQSYFDYLEGQISQLENKRTLQGKLNSEEAKNLGTLTGQRDDIIGKKSALDKFNEGLQKAQQESATLTEYLAYLNKQQEELSQKKPVTKEDFDIRETLAKETVGVKQALREQLTQYLQNVEGSEQQRLAVEKKYAELRLELQKKYKDKTKDEVYATALGNINKGEIEEVRQIRERTTQAAAAFKKLDGVIVESGRAAMKKRLQQLEDYLKDQIAFSDTEYYKNKKKERDDLKVDINNDDIARLSQYAQLVNGLGSALSDLGGVMGAVGGFLTGLTANFNLLSVVLKTLPDTASKAEKAELQEQKVMAGVQAAINLVTDIISAAKERKRVEEEYYRNVIAQQQQYNILLNEEKGLKAKSDPNIFGRDYLGEIKDSYDKLSDAEIKYQDSLKKLNQGRAKVGLNDTLDASAVAKSAITGAVIGSVIPGLGTAVGAIVGGAVGFISGIFGSGKKKEEEFADLLRVYPTLIKKGKDGVDELNVSLAQSLVNSNALDDSTKQLVQNALDWQKQIDEARQAIHDLTKDLVGGLGDKLGDSLVDAFKNGTDAAIAFKGTIEDVLETFITKLIYAKTLKPYLDALATDIEQSLAPGGDGKIDDDLNRFFQGSAEIRKNVNDYLQQAMDSAKSNGFDILRNKVVATSQTQTNALTREAQSLTETTGSILAGTLNAIRIQQAEVAQRMNQQLSALNNIDRNTAGIARTNELLDSVDRRLKNIESDPLRAKGGG